MSDNPRCFVVEVHDYNGIDEFTQYGPYTEARAVQVRDAIDKILDRTGDEVQVNATVQRLAQWNRQERTDFIQGYVS